MYQNFSHTEISSIFELPKFQHIEIFYVLEILMYKDYWNSDML